MIYYLHLYVLLLLLQMPDAPVADSAIAGRVLQFCSMIRSPESYDGKIVVMDAQYDSNEHSAWLSDERCPEGLTIEGQLWPSKVHLWALQHTGMSKHPVDFVPDRRGLALVANIYRATVEAGVRVSVTVEGQFQYYPLAKGVFRGRSRTLGFGHVNAFPAQLIVRRVREVRVVRQ